MPGRGSFYESRTPTVFFLLDLQSIFWLGGDVIKKWQRYNPKHTLSLNQRDVEKHQMVVCRSFNHRKVNSFCNRWPYRYYNPILCKWFGKRQNGWITLLHSKTAAHIFMHFNIPKRPHWMQIHPLYILYLPYSPFAVISKNISVIQAWNW